MRHLLCLLASGLAGMCLSSSAADGQFSISETNLNLTIPDNRPAGLTRILSVVQPDWGPILDLQVRLKLSGGYNGDLYATLTHTDSQGRGGFSVLLNRVGRTATKPGGSPGSGFDITLAPNGPGGDIHLAATNPPNTVLTGVFEPDGRTADPLSVTESTNTRTALLESFLGVDVNGTWTLLVSDMSSLLTAKLVSWQLDFQAAPREQIIAPADLVKLADPGQCFASGVNLGTPGINLPYINVTNDAPTQFSVGITPVVWTVVFTNNDTASATQQVTVLDLQPPLLAQPADITLNVAPGECAITNLDIGTALASDNCGLASLTNNAPMVFRIGLTPITWTAMDVHGNVTSRVQRVTITDTNFTCPENHAAQPVITEFMASNSHILVDEDGEYVDWIEIYNPGPFTIDLEGWSLTDDPLSLTKWKFPSAIMSPGQYLVVFASNKNRHTSGAPLHTNFRLDAGGEYLALVWSDGQTIISEFRPLYPPQLTDISYGFGADWRYTPLVDSQAPVRVLVPSDGTLGQVWTLQEFDDSNWIAGTNGVGFETGVGEAPAVSAAILEKNPVGYWQFEETSGLIAANLGSTGPAQNGSFLNGVTLGAAGPRPPSYPGFDADNRAPHFDGTDDKVDVPYSASLNPPNFTISCWARVTGGAGSYRSPLTSRADSPTRGYIFYASDANVWAFWTGTGGAAGTWDTMTGPAVVLGQWVHLAGTQNGTTKTFYVNGVQVGSKTAAFAPNTVSPLRIGAGASEAAGQFFFNGEVDDVAVFDRAFSAAEIALIFQSSTNSSGAAGSTNFFFTDSIRTDIRSPMLGINSSAWLRFPFVINNIVGINSLTLRMIYDDGFVAYLNGQPVISANAPELPAWNSAATAARRMNASVPNFIDFDISDSRDLLRLGTNMLAIHGLNSSATNGDFLVVAELVAGSVSALSTNARYFTTPTPGKPNSSGTADLGPAISGVSNAPALPVQPTTTQPITVTTRVTPTLAPVASVELRWRVMFSNTVQVVPMFDDGLHGDGAPGDRVYGAVIPAGVALPGQMVRWFITATDTNNRTARWPLFEDPLNSPEYIGTVIADPTLTTNFPVWQWFAADKPASYTRSGVRGAVFFNGEFYDNVFVRQRGGYTAQATSQKFDFNTGYHCRINDLLGRVEEANLNGNGADESYMRPPVAFEIFRVGGHPASYCQPMLMRYNGGPDRVGLFIEQVDERFLDRYNLDRDGALYKFVQRAALTPAFSDTTDGLEKKTRLDEDYSDLQAVVNACLLTNNIEARARFMFDNLNLAGVVNYLACRAVERDTDDVRKNFYFYRDTLGTREWTFFPWDKDLCLGKDADAGAYNAKHPFLGDSMHRKAPNNVQWNMLWEAMFNDPRTRIMYLRRLRTVMDQQLGPAGYLEGRADAWFAPAFPFLGTTVSNYVNTLKNYIAQRRTELYVEFAATNVTAGVTNALIPDSQPGNAVVLIGTIDFNPSSGNQLEEYVQLVNTNDYAVDISGWKLDGAVEHRFKPGTVILPTNVMYAARDAVAFRARATGPRGGQTLFVQGNFNGSLSARGESLVLLDPAGRLVSSNSYAGAPSLAQQYLRVTEIMYNPPLLPGSPFDAQEFEYLELKNVSSTVTLDLRGVRFDRGLDFAFTGSAVTSLAPGGYVLVVENTNAFRERYGSGRPVAGQYAGNLDNDGERIRLLDATGEDILDFDYEDDWHKSTDGRSHSLVTANELAPEAAWSRKTNWLASACRYGSPGLPDPLVACDSDADGLPDWWELDHALSLAVLGSSGDADADGFPDRVEYAMGTDPMDPTIPLRLAVAFDASSQTVVLGFRARSNTTYSVQTTSVLGLGQWLDFTNTAIHPTNRWELIRDSSTGTSRFYRLIIPSPPN